MPTLAYRPAKDSDTACARSAKFLYTEECDLALFRHKASGKQFLIEKDCWDDLIDDIRAA